MPSQLGEEESQQAFVPPAQKQSVSPVAPMKKKRIKIWMKKRQKVIKRIMPFPSVPETIPEDEEEEEEETNEEEEVPTQRRTQLARAMEEERRKSTSSISPSTQVRPLQVEK